MTNYGGGGGGGGEVEEHHTYRLCNFPVTLNTILGHVYWIGRNVYCLLEIFTV